MNHRPYRRLLRHATGIALAAAVLAGTAPAAAQPTARTAADLPPRSPE